MAKKSGVVRWVLVLAGLILPSAQVLAGGTPLTTELVVNGVLRPVHLSAPAGDTNRLFVVEQRGAVRVIQGGVLLPTPFLDIDALVSNVTGQDERGMHSIAFHPNYYNNGFFYVTYVDNGNVSRVVRYTVLGNPATSNTADPNSAFQIMSLAQPFSNHNGGQLAFGPRDNFFYISWGDGGSANDPGNRAQNTTLLFGKLLRIDVDGGSPYAIPASNPGFPRGEIWAYGLRNLWRFSFDLLNGDIYMGDVGQNAWEEIDFQRGDSTGGQNYGWRPYEGNACILGPCNPAGMTFPIHAYANPGVGRSVTGGEVYRGCDIPDLYGTYFFADWSSNRIWSFRVNRDTVPPTIIGGVQDRTAELAPGGGLFISSISSFGTDGRGEMYICDLFGGEIFRIKAASGPIGGGRNGDFDGDNDVDLLDFSKFQLCFGGSNNPPPANPPGCAITDLDCDGDTDLADFLIFQQNFTGSQ